MSMGELLPSSHLSGAGVRHEGRWKGHPGVVLPSGFITERKQVSLRRAGKAGAKTECRRRQLMGFGVCGCSMPLRRLCTGSTCTRNAKG